MGGINCRPGRRDIGEITAETLRLEYVDIVKNVFKQNSTFSNANIEIENLMHNEVSYNIDTQSCMNNFNKAMDYLNMSINICVTCSYNVESLINDLNKIENDDIKKEINKLGILNMHIDKQTDYMQNLKKYYIESDPEKNIKNGNFNVIIRNNNVTVTTEKLVNNMASILIDLKDFSVLSKDKDIELLNI